MFKKAYFGSIWFKLNRINCRKILQKITYSQLKERIRLLQVWRSNLKLAVHEIACFVLKTRSMSRLYLNRRIVKNRRKTYPKNMRLLDRGSMNHRRVKCIAGKFGNIWHLACSGIDFFAAWLMLGRRSPSPSYSAPRSPTPGVGCLLK